MGFGYDTDMCLFYLLNMFRLGERKILTNNH